MPAPTAVIASPPNPNHTNPATLGIVLATSVGRILGDDTNSQGFGGSALVHPVNGYPFEVSIDYERDAYDGGDRTDHRIGYSLYIGSNTKRLGPYVVIPMGVNIVTRTDLDTKVEGYVGIGGGVKLQLDHWRVTADARVLTRAENATQDETMVLPSEFAVEGRASVGYVF